MEICPLASVFGNRLREAMAQEALSVAATDYEYASS